MGKRPLCPMNQAQRAKQFMPFAALKGLSEALARKERITIPKKELSEDALEELDRFMHELHIGQMITVIYYDQDEYVKKTGLVAHIDQAGRILQVVHTNIEFDNIFSITW